MVSPRRSRPARSSSTSSFTRPSSGSRRSRPWSAAVPGAIPPMIGWAAGAGNARPGRVGAVHDPLSLADAALSRDRLVVPPGLRARGISDASRRRARRGFDRDGRRFSTPRRCCRSRSVSRRLRITGHVYFGGALACGVAFAAAALAVRDPPVDDLGEVALLVVDPVSSRAADTGILGQGVVKPVEEAGDERSPEVRRRVRRTAWLIAAVITFLGVGAACFIAKNGRKSRTVLHSELL